MTKDVDAGIAVLRVLKAIIRYSATSALDAIQHPDPPMKRKRLRSRGRFSKRSLR